MSSQDIVTFKTSGIRKIILEIIVFLKANCSPSNNNPTIHRQNLCGVHALVTPSGKVSVLCSCGFILPIVAQWIPWLLATGY